ncbi:hypothetical protein KPSA3_07404 [Pseudomonas syringae pv. actinidiae]|uniref:Uncharacterized protein n=1 Tax=Pseudomonas syringae pv. actinidiae TaxID=103796 RepID=A0AAN4QC77_PSESF|nr:hypothetical protein KPSA3_07404 [Pseudomonas syringae pv. actinidiae]
MFLWTAKPRARAIGRTTTKLYKKRISALALIRGDARGAERPRQVRQPA